jgi:NAD(P)-dependent dehydrogenase (short-subunit alcohol dehydrogenase family)
MRSPGTSVTMAVHDHRSSNHRPVAASAVLGRCRMSYDSARTFWRSFRALATRIRFPELVGNAAATGAACRDQFRSGSRDVGADSVSHRPSQGPPAERRLEARRAEPLFWVNFFGSYHTSKAVLPQMVKRGYSRLLHIGSIASKEGDAGMLTCSASKAAVIAMAKVQGKEMAGTGVTVNALAPAVIRTAMVDATPERQGKYMTDKIPMGRCGSLDEVVAMVEFIVSPGCSFTTGFTFDLSGGRATC